MICWTPGEGNPRGPPKHGNTVMERSAESTHLLLGLFYFAACQPRRAISEQALERLQKIFCAEVCVGGVGEFPITHFAACSHMSQSSGVEWKDDDDDENNVRWGRLKLENWG